MEKDRMDVGDLRDWWRSVRRLTVEMDEEVEIDNARMDRKVEIDRE